MVSFLSVSDRRRLRYQWGLAALLLLLIPLSSCRSERSETADLWNHVEGVEILDCHEHIRNFPGLDPEDYNFYTILTNSYLYADLVSAGADRLSAEEVNTGELDRLWQKTGRFLPYVEQTSYYRQLLEGFRLLYDYSEPRFTRSGIAYLSRRIRDNYRNREQWFQEAFETAGFDRMLLDKHWDPYNPAADSKYFLPVFNFTALVDSVHRREQLEASPGRNPFSLARRRGTPIEGLDDFLAVTEIMLQEAIADGAVALKNTLAYSRSLRFDAVSREQAARIFEREDLGSEETARLQDFLVDWLAERAGELDIPIQIHTGYLAGNGNRLYNSRPILLNDLFLQHPETRFVLFHGGFPWTGECNALAKMFPNVYLDLVWLPQISYIEAVRALDEMLDCVPYNKIFWGGDSHFIEEAAGSLRYGQRVIVEVLTRRIERGDLSLEKAREIASAILRDNALSFFQLEDRLMQSPPA